LSFNGSGLFVINSSGQPVVSGTDIDPTVFNALTADLATGLSNCIAKDGQTTVTANIPMATYKFTGLGAGSARTDSASLANVQDGTGVYVATVGGTADVITITPSPAITAYTAGQTFRFIASGTNTTNVTVNANALGAKAITKNGTNALTAGDIPSGTMVTITYDGTRFILGAVHREQPQPNPIINGNMDIWQRGTSFAAPANATYFADRWRIAYSTTGVVTASRSTSVPTVAESGVLFNYSLDLDVTTADAAIAAGDYCALQQSIEGFNWRHFAQRDVTLSFWVYATKTGTHCISISNSGLDRSYVAEYVGI